MSTRSTKQRLKALGLALAAFGAAPAALAEWELNMRQGITDISRGVYDLHMLIFWICVAIAVVVFGAMIISIVLHRKSKGVEPAKFSHSTKAEIIWTIIPVVILVGMAIPSAEMLVKMEDTSDPDMSIKITGYQWKWGYDYIDHGVSFYSNLADSSKEARLLDSGVDVTQVDNYLLDVDRRMVVPQGAKVRLLITAADVIHAWWMPDLSIKKDAIPGYVNEVWFQTDEIGVFRGQCAELCGRDHGFMPIVVEVKSPEDFDAWVEEQGGTVARNTDLATPVATVASNTPETIQVEVASEWTLDTLMARGQTTYNTQCASCHQANGRGLPPTFPSLVDSPVVKGDVAAHLDVVLNGRPGTPMLPWLALSDEDIASVMTYQRNAWGIDSGDVVLPADVKAAR